MMSRTEIGLLLLTVAVTACGGAPSTTGSDGGVDGPDEPASSPDAGGGREAGPAVPGPRPPFGINLTSYGGDMEVLDDIDALGVEHVRLAVVWEMIQPGDGGDAQGTDSDPDNDWRWVNYDGISYDDVISDLVLRDIEVIALLHTTPRWAAADPDCPSRHRGNDEHCPPRPDAYAEFVRSAVLRYKPGGVLSESRRWPAGRGVTHWEIWNEPNLGWFWPGGTHEQYVALLEEAAAAARGADPSSRILIAGLSQIDLIPALESYYLSGAKEHFDVMNFHFYPPTQGYGGYGAIVQVVEGIRELMRRFDDSDKPLWDLEGGYGNDSDETLQCEYMVRFFLANAALGVERVSWFHVFDEFEAESDPTFRERHPNEEWGLAHKLGRRLHAIDEKLGWYTYQLVSSKLSGADFQTMEFVRLPSADDDIAVVRLQRGDETVYVLWWDYFRDPVYEPGDTKTALVEVQGSSFVATQAVPSFSAGEQVPSFDEAFATTVLAASDGTIEVTLGEAPVFVEPTR